MLELLPLLVQLGLPGFSIFLLIQVLTELKANNKFNQDLLNKLIDNDQRAEMQRMELYKATTGLNTQDLKRQLTWRPLADDIENLRPKP